MEGDEALGDVHARESRDEGDDCDTGGHDQQPRLEDP
jgi:hypothetical protein